MALRILLEEHGECLAKNKVNNICCSPHVHKVTYLITENCSLHKACSVLLKATDTERQENKSSIYILELLFFGVLQNDRQNFMKKTHSFSSVSSHFLLAYCLFVRWLVILAIMSFKRCK